ncbi:MAG: hypothetical protein APR63_09395 [Desulfuromonas sp. SDB]|nr:MAG: hypothetical protein APR63_09395 [Desulfuromonas sp. SDB]
MKKRLGKGLDALLSASPQIENEKLLELDITLLQPGKLQPRTKIDPEALEELTSSIKQDGIIEPLIIRPAKQGKYEIICGERRYQAAKKANLTKVPVIIKEVNDLKALEISLVENLQRENLSALDEAEGYLLMSNRFHLSHLEIAERMGKSRSAIANSLRLLSLPQAVKELIKLDKLTAGHGRALLSLQNDPLIEETAKKITHKNLSVRETEDLVKELKKVHKPKKRRVGQKRIPELDNLERQLSEKIGKPVKIQIAGKKGKVVIEFFNYSDLNSLLEYLGIDFNEPV